MEKINFRQFSVIVFYLLLSLKFMALPSLIYLECKTDSWLVFVLMFTIDILLVALVLYFMHCSGQRTFYEFLIQRFGVVVSKIICFVFLIAFLLDLADGLTSMQRLLLQNFYQDFPWQAFVFPLLIVLSIMVYRGLRNIGRVCEIWLFLVIGAILFIILKSIPEFDLTFFLPAFTNGIKPVLTSAFKHISWFGTPITLLFMLGQVDLTNRKKSTLIKFIALAVVEALVLVCVFYGVFRSTSGLHSFAISDLSQVSNTSTALDELSWLAVSVWTVAQTLQLAILFYSSVVAFRNVFNVKNSWLPIFIIDLIVLIYQTISNQTVNLENIFFYPTIINIQLSIKFGLTALIFVGNWIYIKKGRKKNAKT